MEFATMARISSVLVAGCLLVSAAAASAQDPLTAQLYGSGVHAFFSGDSKGAYESLTAAIEGGSQDPRVFYFRGFTEQRMGRPQDAEADFQKGAELEGGDMNGVFPVSKSLERIQGSRRGPALEKYRSEGPHRGLPATRKISDRWCIRSAATRTRNCCDKPVPRPVPRPSRCGSWQPATGDLFGDGPRITTSRKGRSGQGGRGGAGCSRPKPIRLAALQRRLAPIRLVARRLPRRILPPRKNNLPPRRALRRPRRATAGYATAGYAAAC